MASSKSSESYGTKIPANFFSKENVVSAKRLACRGVRPNNWPNEEMVLKYLRVAMVKVRNPRRGGA